jgi:nucleoside-diphosphate-sugar epimerase
MRALITGGRGFVGRHLEDHLVREGDDVVAKVLEIVAYFQPKCWLFENPGTGLLHTRQVVQGIPYKAIT